MLETKTNLKRNGEAPHQGKLFARQFRQLKTSIMRATLRPFGGMGAAFFGMSICLFRTQCRQETKLPAHVSAVSTRLFETPSHVTASPVWGRDPGSGQAAASDTPASPPPVHPRISFRKSSYHVRPQKTHSDEHTSPGP